MRVHVHSLGGCTPTPLAHYLKGLGIFRVVSAQRDADARAFWKNDVFHLATVLDDRELLTFICDTYEPTPLVAPWNGGSGFYSKDAKTGIDAIASSRAPRLASYRQGIAQARVQVQGLEERPEDEEKAALLAACQRTWSEASLDWFSAAVSLARDGTGRYPALLGTGGNDGRLDFTNNFMQRLAEAIDMESGKALSHTWSLVELALFGTPHRGLERQVIGQFLPGGAGGANGTAGFSADCLINPWDFILMLEGAVLLRVGALRKLDGSELALAAAPFALRGTPSGYASAAADDDGGRGEQWLPMWSGPTTLGELRRVFAEARFARGETRAEGAVDAARAIAELGIARGIDGFVRFAFMERNGQSNLAIPLDRIQAQERPSPGIRLLDELDEWMDSLRRAVSDKHAPASFGRTFNRIQSIVFDLCIASGSQSSTWAMLLEELCQAEELIVRSSRFTAERKLHPVPLLSASWLEKADDGSPEFRLARALSSTHAPLRRGSREMNDDLGPVRVHCLPLDADAGFRRFASSANGLRKDPRVVWTGADLSRDLAALVLRRALEGEQRGFEGLPLQGETFASIEDISMFIESQLDDRRLARLARGLMAVRSQPLPPLEDARPLALYALFRATQLDASEVTRRSLPLGFSARCDLQTLRLLHGGRLDDATHLAVARLGAMGRRVKLNRAGGDSSFALRLLASLAFPIGPKAIRRVLNVVSQPFDFENRETP